MLKSILQKTLYAIIGLVICGSALSFGFAGQSHEPVYDYSNRKVDISMEACSSRAITPTDIEVNDFRLKHTIINISSDEVALSDKLAVESAITAYGALSFDAQTILLADKANLDRLANKIAKLEKQLEKQAVIDKEVNNFRLNYPIINTLIDDVMIYDKPNAMVAIKIYNTLSQDAQIILLDDRANLDKILERSNELWQGLIVFSIFLIIFAILFIIGTIGALVDIMRNQYW